LGDRRKTPGLLLFAALKSAFLLLAPALVLTLPSDLEGQTIRGKILDEITGEPISNANVELLAGSKGDEVVGRALTDAAGMFLLDAGAQGRFRLSAERIGYQKVIAPPVDIMAGDTLAVELRMAVDAIPLAPLTVVSDRPPLLLRIRLEEGGYVERRDLYGREGLGMGHFLLESGGPGRADRWSQYSHAGHHQFRPRRVRTQLLSRREPGPAEGRVHRRPHLALLHYSRRSLSRHVQAASVHGYAGPSVRCHRSLDHVAAG